MGGGRGVRHEARNEFKGVADDMLRRNEDVAMAAGGWIGGRVGCFFSRFSSVAKFARLVHCD